ncbi:NfeD1-b protein [Alkalihalophilus pseudofirmus OF4]|uniref:NfeD1-b protein n=1 Tax=Alkalihalophilus pseudofirmus (strain ATCC BAA-2126 / JCM 17055 / OF4) TaxID=398511 RepID=D3FY18_ALKPO|nr:MULTISPECIES: nodulation protein NfeD [Alkalihalophilus]ADC50777.1 NfeD1-b protein [Alkalihalophilus pseudofirmus OF4]MED1602476.1 nodulation protein NfeD [Alkalihalophilus marmarensis]
MNRIRLNISLLFILCAMLLIPLQSFVYSETNTSDDTVVYYIPVEQTVERGLAAFMQRSFQSAADEGADYIVLEIHTPGGAVDAAGEIARLMQNTDIPIIAFVTKEAISAGAYIALNADEIVMAPGTTMGAAGVIDGAGNAAEEKAQSYWLAEMRAAAELNDRDPLYALAMADRSIEIPDLGVSDEEFLTLTPSEAIEVGYAEAIASNRAELIEYLGLEQVSERDMQVSFAEQIARFVTHPVVIPILLSIGSLGLVLELYSPGFGVPGFMGLLALGLFFFGHLFAGFAGWESILLFGIGFLLIMIEIFIPGFGIFGVLGIGAVIGGMLLASFSMSSMVISIFIAVILTAIGTVFIFRYFGNRGPWKKLILTDSTSSEKGYISNHTRAELLEMEGETLTPLRPSGSAVFSGERLDVVSEGGYIEQGRKIQVVYTSGSRIVVREVKKNS